VCALFLAIEKLLQPRNQTIADIFTVMGRDESVLDERPLPQQAVLKSGTLDTVSALGGALPTQKAGVVWFVVMNNEGNVEGFRALQEKLLANLEQSLGQATAVPAKLAVTPSTTSALSYKQLWSRL
jgi:serine-type D-Ala-D-Ala carboxypeptidase/endopeptidase (penicillin-binding protein 4)